MRALLAQRSTGLSAAGALLMLFMLAGCMGPPSGPPAKINKAIGSPCGVGGGFATAGAGLGMGMVAGLAAGSIASLTCGPLYPFCLAASVVAGGVYGLGEGTADAIEHTPSCEGQVAVAPAVAPGCAPGDADCVARQRAEAEERAAAAEAERLQRDKDRSILHDPAARAAERAEALAREQQRFDAWYVTHQGAVQHELGLYALRENVYSADCGMGPARITAQSVSDVGEDGYVVDLRWWKPGKFMGCEVHRHDRFLLRVDDDLLLGIDYRGLAAAAVERER